MHPNKKITHYFGATPDCKQERERERERALLIHRKATANDVSVRDMAAKKETEARATEQSSLLATHDSTVSATSTNASDERGASLWKDVHDTFTLAMPIFLSMLSWVGVRVMQ